MIDIRAALRSYLLSDATVSSLVGGARVHYGRLPQGQVDPSVVVNKISETGDYSHAGDTGLGQVRMQVDALAQTVDVATQLANAVYDRLSGARGLVDTVFIGGIFLANARDEYDDIAKLNRVSRDYTVWYNAK